MKRVLTAAALVIGLAGAASADPIEGMWRTAKDDNGNSGLIKVVPCGNAYCGTLIKAYGPNGSAIKSDNVGKKLIWDTVNKGDGLYRGKVFSPDRGKTYSSKLIMKGSKLVVSGCVLGVCREGGVWTKQ